MYFITGTNFNDINTFCNLYGLTDGETIEAAHIMKIISTLVK